MSILLTLCPLHITTCHVFLLLCADFPLTLFTAHIRALISGVEAENHPAKSIHYITKFAHHIIKLPLRNKVCTRCNSVTTEYNENNQLNNIKLYGHYILFC